MRYPVDRTSDDGLQTTIWEFDLIAPMGLRAKIVVDSYMTGTRPSKRHKFQWTAKYVRGMRNRSDLKAEQVPLPDDVKAEALQLVMQSITIEV